ncbi:unnamed protein product [Candidula unifasciata]|uniref:Selenoprotein P N-terminal domain-containing protein n=1 Tax=Candidula unifasciata TaxID=100452 RepID=A0A8S3YPA0_9EUPU|nr:unnamed protein product [Candidula unifasciata]
MAAGHLALLCLGLCLLMTDVLSQRRCSVPVWQPELGSNPITSNRGKVLLVALLRGYCSYCVGQARRLESLKNNLTSQGFPDIAMLIVNGGEGMSRRNVQNLIDASSIPVLQDNENHALFRNVFSGNKDDFVVYDRCGQRVAYIPHPYSYLGNNVTERVLKAVHNGRHTCRCRLDRARNNPHDVMYGDQPDQPTHIIHDNTLGLDCPPTDRWCRRYLRNYRRNRLEPSTDSLQNPVSNRTRPRHQEHGDEQSQSPRGHNRHNHRSRNNHNHHNNQSQSRVRVNGSV